MIMSINLCKKVIMGEAISLGAQPTIFSNSFLCSASRVMLR